MPPISVVRKQSLLSVIKNDNVSLPAINKVAAAADSVISSLVTADVKAVKGELHKRV